MCSIFKLNIEMTDEVIQQFNCLRSVLDRADLIFCCVSGDPTVYFIAEPVGRRKKINGENPEKSSSGSNGFRRIYGQKMQLR